MGKINGYKWASEIKEALICLRNSLVTLVSF
jgi:hypothetical protein